MWEQHAKFGFAAAAIFPGVEEGYYKGIPELGGVARKDWDIWCDFLVSRASRGACGRKKG